MKYEIRKKLLQIIVKEGLFLTDAGRENDIDVTISMATNCIFKSITYT